jgi:hypothetical protein
MHGSRTVFTWDHHPAPHHPDPHYPAPHHLAKNAVELDAYFVKRVEKVVIVVETAGHQRKIAETKKNIT